MKRSVYVLSIALAAAAPVGFAQDYAPPPPHPPAQLTLPPNFQPPLDLPPDEEPPLECDLNASPDFIPGVDVKGRPVVPADLPTGRQVEIDTRVYAEVGPRNRRLPRTGVVVDLPDLGAPACVPLDEKKLPK
jgi:hypothetical protein